MNVSKVLTKDYEKMDTWWSGKNKPNSNPIQSQSNPIKANKMPKQTQFKPKQTQSPPAIGAKIVPRLAITSMALVPTAFTSRYFSTQKNLRGKSNLIGFSDSYLKTILTLRQPFKVKAGEGNLLVLVLNTAFAESSFLC